MCTIDTSVILTTTFSVVDVSLRIVLSYTLLLMLRVPYLVSLCYPHDYLTTCVLIIAVVISPLPVIISFIRDQIQSRVITLS